MVGRANTGGGITLHVIGGTTKPTAAGENTIWLNTSITIGDWCIQNTAPESPNEGDVYITTRFATDNVLNISHPHTVSLYLGTARQYQSGAWVELQGEVFYSADWHKLNTYVYDGDLNATDGNYNSQIGGYPWTTGTDGGSASISSYSDHFTYSYYTYGAQWAASNKKIDFTDVKTVKIIYSCSGSNLGYFIVYTNKNTSGTRNPDARSGQFAYVTKGTATIDTSHLTGNFWLGMSTGAASGANGQVDIYKIELIS